MPDTGDSVPGNPPTPGTLTRATPAPTTDQVLWMTIRNRTKAVAFHDYCAFIDDVMARPSNGTQAFELLRQATDAFLMHESFGADLQEWLEQHPTYTSRLGRARLDPTLLRVWLGSATNSEFSSFEIEEERRLGYAPSPDLIAQMHEAYYEHLRDEVLVLPYLKLVRDAVVLPSRLVTPVCVELLWSYWHEEGMLVQTFDAILDRFRNRRLADQGDALARHDWDALLPLGDLLESWSQSSDLRQTMRRRAAEYQHAYGLELRGHGSFGLKPVFSRSRFIGAFHILLHLAHVFFKEDCDQTVVADSLPVLNALREVHLVLAEGAHNQFGDVAASARAEMLMMQWILARPEMGSFLGEPTMVPYEESWMRVVDLLNRIYDWTATSSTISHELAVSGEQILLSVRYGNWSRVSDSDQAVNWARYWRLEIQRYVHALRSATGIDLTQPG